MKLTLKCWAFFKEYISEDAELEKVLPLCEGILCFDLREIAIRIISLATQEIIV